MGSDIIILPNVYCFRFQKNSRYGHNKGKNLPFDIHTNIYSLYVLFNCAKDLLYD